MAHTFRTIGGELVDVRESTTFEDMEQCLHDFHEQQISYLGIAGGDGTIHQVITRFIRIYNESGAIMPPVVILKGGTMDNVSRTIRLKGKGPDILKRMVTSIRNSMPILSYERDTLQIDNYYCFLFGAGFVTNFLNEAYSGKEKGFWKNLYVIRKSIIHAIRKPKRNSIFQGFTATVRVDGKELPYNDMTAILSGTVEEIGMGFSPLSRAHKGPGTFHTIISSLEPLEFLPNLPAFYEGKSILAPNHFDDVVTSMEILSQAPFEYTMDGDIYTCDGSLTVRTGRSIRLVYV